MRSDVVDSDIRVIAGLQCTFAEAELVKAVLQ